VSTPAHELKRLQREVKEGQKLLVQLRQQQAALDDQLVKAQQSLAAAQEEIERLTRSGGVVVVSEHAFLRYFQRVLGINLDEQRASILPLDVELQILHLGDGTYPVDFADGRGCVSHHVVVKGGVVVTILGDDERK
jgi:hypothetical protein